LQVTLTFECERVGIGCCGYSPAHWLLLGAGHPRLRQWCVPPQPPRPPRTGPPGPAFTAPRSLQEEVSRDSGPVAETLALLTLAEALAPGLTFRRTRRGGNVAAGDGWISFKWIASRRQLRVGLLGGVADYQCSSALPLRLSDAKHVAFVFADAAELDAAKDYIQQAARRRAGDSAS
jgi:hypothetical protein